MRLKLAPTFVLVLFFSSLLGCSKIAPEKIKGRLPASLQTPSCEIERHHDFKDQYRLKYMGRKYDRYWYSRRDILELKQEFVDSGRCE